MKRKIKSFITRSFPSPSTICNNTRHYNLQQRCLLNVNETLLFQLNQKNCITYQRLTRSVSEYTKLSIYVLVAFLSFAHLNPFYVSDNFTTLPNIKF